MKAFFLSLVIGALSLAGLAALRFESGAGFDYAGSSEARQQAFLDHVAADMRVSVARRADGVELAGITPDAGRDVIFATLRYRDAGFETPPAQQVDFLKKYMYTENCRHAATRAVIERGVRLEFRVLRPSGAPLAELTFDRRVCAPIAVALRPKGAK